ncbi:hypothetical protein [Microbulbifer discodermiae]|uniref:hypothetical protein n=1 Tax=Microbulbifer sp. 2201CG32-9 TaxID=3232309 RepID=UPI00345BF1F8
MPLLDEQGRPDHSCMRTLLGRHMGLPALDREESLWQQSEVVRQKVDASGHWSRDTHGDIRETALQRNTWPTTTASTNRCVNTRWKKSPG